MWTRRWGQGRHWASGSQARAHCRSAGAVPACAARRSHRGLLLLPPVTPRRASAPRQSARRREAGRAAPPLRDGPTSGSCSRTPRGAHGRPEAGAGPRPHCTHLSTAGARRCSSSTQPPPRRPPRPAGRGARRAAGSARSRSTGCDAATCSGARAHAYSHRAASRRQKRAITQSPFRLLRRWRSDAVPHATAPLERAAPPRRGEPRSSFDFRCVCDAVT
jgi:hypothetical protein